MQISERFHIINIPFGIPTPTGGTINRFVNAVLYRGARHTALFDAGVDSGASTLKTYLEQAGTSYSEVDQLILSHAHPDHVGGARRLVNASGCRVTAHEAERGWIEHIDRQAQERPVPGFSTLVGASVEVEQIVVDNEEICLDKGDTVRVIHTPGHSRGSISLWHQKDGVLFCGDALPVPGEMPIYEDLEATVNSIRRIASFTDAKWLVSSWDRPRQCDEIQETIRESLAWIERIDTAIRAAAGDGDAVAMGPLTAAVMESLGLPRHAANMLSARTVAAHLRVTRTLTDGIVSE